MLINLVMCKNYNCRIREHCFRYRKVPQKYGQVYYVDNPGDEHTCSCFFSTKGEDNVLPLDTCDHNAEVGKLSDDDLY